MTFKGITHPEVMWLKTTLHGAYIRVQNFKLFTRPRGSQHCETIGKSAKLNHRTSPLLVLFYCLLQNLLHNSQLSCQRQPNVHLKHVWRTCAQLCNKNNNNNKIQRNKKILLKGCFVYCKIAFPTVFVCSSTSELVWPTTNHQLVYLFWNDNRLISKTAVCNFS